MHNLPFAQPGQFYRGNLHTHCTESDGDYPVEEVVRRYREKGYDFLALSDHFLECYDYPVTDTRSFRSDNFTTLIAHAVEVYNHGSQMKNDRGDGWGLCDVLLNRGSRLHAFATDDAHHMAHDAFGGWIFAKAERLEPQLILQSLKSGAFYSSQGPQIENITIEGDVVSVECSPASTVIISGRGSRSDKVFGTKLRSARLPLGRFVQGHFRITVVDAQGRKAWSNPVWLS